MSRCIISVALFVLTSLLVRPFLTTTAQSRTTQFSYESLEALEQNLKPSSANPYFAFLPSFAEPDYAYWEQWMHLKGIENAQHRRETTRAITHTELEPTNETGFNDSPATAEFITAFGLGAGEDPALDINGVLSRTVASGALAGPFAEDDGAIQVANPIIVPAGSFAVVDASIGDGPHGSSAAGTGDFDFYRLDDLTIGETIEIQVLTPVPQGDLDPSIAIWNSQGRILAFNEDASAANFDSFIRYVVPTTPLFLSVHGFRSLDPADNLPTNPFNSASGQGAGSEGTYRMIVGKSLGDLDHYSFDLDEGDILGANLSTTSGDMAIRLFGPSGETLIASRNDGSGGYGEGSPLPGGGPASFAYVIGASGTYTTQVLGSPNATYTLQLRAFRPSLEADPAGSKQILFLDFDGATINANDLFGSGNTSATLSPFNTFLPSWGLSAADESAVIDAILATVNEGTDIDIATNGSNPNFDIEIRNSRDHADPFGEPNVSRMIIGGTISELGIQTIGIADSIDVGNFAHEETAVVLLDILSAPAGSANSLNSFSLAQGTDIIDIIGVGVGNIINHEAGHYFGNWHTDQFNETANLMDQGGNLPLSILGVGADGIFGSADDIDPSHVTDIYNPSELYGGSEDTLNTIAYGLSTPSAPPTAVTLQTQAQGEAFNVNAVVVVVVAAMLCTLGMVTRRQRYGVGMY